MLRSAFLPWCLLAVAAVNAGGCELISSHRVEAIAADAKNARRSDGASLLAGENVASGTSVQTGSNGRVDLILLPNMLLRLQENGALHIDHLKLTVDGNETDGGIRERAAAVRLSRGVLIARLEQHGYNTASFALQTSRGLIRAEAGALIEVTEQPDVTSAICVRGHLLAAPFIADHISTIGPGETMRIDSARSRHLTLSPAERAAAEARCSRADAALQYEAAAQMEVRR